MRTATTAICFATASCLLYVALAVPDRTMKAREHHKAAVSAGTYVYSNMEEYLEASNPETREGVTKVVESDYELSERKEAEGVADISGVLTSNVPFPPDVPSFTNAWKKVGYLDMTDPTQQCPPSWSKIPSPRASCGKKSTGGACDSLTIGTSGASYQTVCGRFRGYQVGTPDAFAWQSSSVSIENTYADGMSITYGLPGQRKHIFTYAAAVFETQAGPPTCPCAGGQAAPSFVGSDFYCESGNPGSTADGTTMFSADVLWDGQQCNGLEATCCNPPNLAWFCKTLPAPITGDLEVRMCMDEPTSNENMALEFFELYIK